MENNNWSVLYLEPCLHSKTKYLQLDKEALGIRCIRFHQYLYGRKLVLYTDHKPLTHIFNPSRSIPQVVSSRLQCWSLVERIVTQSFIVQARITQMLMPWDISLSQIPLRLFLSLAIALSDENSTPNQIKDGISQDLILLKFWRYVHTTWMVSLWYWWKPPPIQAEEG